jgi:hypothetical protein
LVTAEVLQKVAERQGEDPPDLSPPLQTVIDTDAIEALFLDERDNYICLEFTYLGYNVTIEGEVEPRVTVEDIRRSERLR